jgi:two-component system, LuxR family, sensor kinase FixL
MQFRKGLILMGISTHTFESERVAPLGRAQKLQERAWDGAVAHELVQPLTALLLYLQSARRADPHDPMLVKACNEAERLSAVVSGMRGFAERRPPACRSVELPPLVDDAIAVALLDDPRRVRLVRADGAELPRVVADPVQIQQVVVNLVRNALRAVSDRPDGEIHISTAVRGRSAEVVVQDNGPGVPPKQRAELFVAFAGTGRGGLGLGLAISRAIAERHGGALRLAPQRPGRGAAFVLRLPIADATHRLHSRRDA